MKTISLNNEIKIDLEKLIDSRLLVQANSGGGKSWILRRILEQSHGKVQQIIIDPEGEFATLREKYEYVLCGKEADVPAESRSAALLAHRLLEFKTSAIIDLYELHPQERKHFVRLFLDSLINAPKNLWHPVIVVIDEAHTFVPEKGDSEAASSVIGLASLGRKRGFCAVLATQRISKLHKDAAAECNNKLIGRTALDIDRKRASEELGFTSKEQSLSLRTLEPGSFFGFGPAISNEVIEIKVGKVETTHPKAGSSRLVKLAPPTQAIREVLSKLKDLPAEAEKEAKTVADLKKENTELKRQNTIQKKEVLGGFDQKFVEKAIKDAKKTWDSDVLTKIRPIEKYQRDMLAILKKATELSVPKPFLMSANSDQFVVPVIKSPSFTFIEKHGNKGNTIEGDFTPSRSQQKILDMLCWIENIGRGKQAKKNQVAFLSDQSPTSSGYSNNLGALRSAGLIAYPSPGHIGLTDAGRSVAEPPEQPVNDRELQEQVRAKVSKSQWAILEVLIEYYPAPVPKEVLAERAGQSATSSGYSNNLGSLRTLGLIDYPSSGMVVALSTLFIE